MSDRKYLIALTDLTAFMRRALLTGKPYHMLDLAKELHEDQRVIEDLLAEALLSDYRDEQLEIFCSQIVSTIWPKEMNSTTVKVNFDVGFPPRKIFAALSQYPLEKVDAMLDSKEGRELMAQYISRFWTPARDAWLAKLDSDISKSTLATRLNELYPNKGTWEEMIVDAIIKRSAPTSATQAADMLSELFNRDVKPGDIISM